MELYFSSSNFTQIKGEAENLSQLLLLSSELRRKPGMRHAILKVSHQCCLSQGCHRVPVSVTSRREFNVQSETVNTPLYRRYR